jgi:signal transduction histidine kinase
VLGAESPERLFWGLLGGGLAFRFTGDVAWVLQQALGMEVRGFAPQDVAYALSYPLFLGAMLRLVHARARGITAVVALDSVSVALSTGMLAWYFVLGPEAERAGLSAAREVVVALSLPALDAALLFLALVVLSAARRQVFAGLLVAAWATLLAADGLYLAARSQGPYQIGGWPEVFWALGVLLVGVAITSGAPEIGGPKAKIAPWRVFLFWFGPLSPSVHFCLLLLWSVAHPPVPGYLLLGAAALLLYLAGRVALVSFATSHLSREQEEFTRQTEKGWVLDHLHDTVKQSAHGLSLTINAALEADRRGDADTARKLLDRALQSAREAEFQISRPYDELQADGEGMHNPDYYLHHRLERFEEYFGIKTHQDLRVPLNLLSTQEMATTYRVAVEAFWNVAKHSRARNMYLESRRVGDVLIFRVRDDGRGFDAEDPAPGVGLSFLRQRAHEVGAELDVISSPGHGATVQIRFEDR